jgi:uncharacterized membrane protein YkvA (DUF1232 family)
VVFFLRVFSVALIVLLGVFYYLLQHSDALTGDVQTTCVQCEQFLSTSIFNLRQLLSPLSSSAVGAAAATSPPPLYHDNRIQILLALLYIVSPLDLIPDAIPFVGWFDDGAALIFVTYKIILMACAVIDLPKDNTVNDLLLLCCIIYIGSPLDFIPDLIPVVGWIDDGFVFLFACIFLMRAIKSRM